MPEDGSPRPRRIRRTLIAIARAAGLFTLIVGINGVLGIAVPRLEQVPRYLISLIVGVTIFESLRPGRRRAPATVATPITDDSTAELAEARSLIDGLRAEIQRARDDSMEREAAMRHETEELIAISDGLRREVADLTETVTKERAAGDEARTREAQLREQYGAESEHLQRAAGRALEEIQHTRAAADEQRAQLEHERKRAGEALQEIEKVRKAGEAQLAAAAQEIVKLRAESQRERQRADQGLRELQNALSAAAGVATQRQKLEAQLADFDRRLPVAMQELEALRAERQRVRREMEETRQGAEVEKGDLRRSLETAANAKLQEVVNKLTTERETAIAEAVAARDAARAEAQSLTSALQSERQHAVEAAARRSALEEEIASLRVPAVDEKALRESIDAEWSAKLQKIVTELAMDHENDIGESLAAREAAKAETRSLNLRVKELQQLLESARDGRLGLLRRDDEMTRELDAERQARARLEAENAALKVKGSVAQTAPVDEKMLREAIDIEWSTKLQTIVSHMAADHESDIGKAIEEREAARAEARNLAMKISSLQTKLVQAQQEIATLRSAPPPPPPPAPAPVDEDELRARAEVLQFAEQAHDAIRRATSPGDVPVPAAERRARVLFVHHDPAMRTMWRDNLGKSGFDVQTAADGLEGLRLTMAGKPDVVIADASMPKMGGHELCQLIKSNQETAGVKVILMTGVYTNEVPIEAASGGFEADELLRKPVKFETLKAALSNLLPAV